MFQTHVSMPRKQPFTPFQQNSAHTRCNQAKLTLIKLALCPEQIQICLPLTACHPCLAGLPASQQEQAIVTQAAGQGEVQQLSLL